MITEKMMTKLLKHIKHEYNYLKSRLRFLYYVDVNKQPFCYVDNDGMVRLPSDVISHLKLEDGGSVVFFKNIRTGQVHMLNEEMVEELCNVK